MREASDGSTASYYVIPNGLDTLKMICKHMRGVRKIPIEVIFVFKRLYLYGEYEDHIDVNLPKKHDQLQDLISYKNMNGQIAECFRSLYRYGQSSHSDQLRDLKKVQFYLTAEAERLDNVTKHIIDVLNRGGVDESAHIRVCKNDVEYMLDVLGDIIKEFKTK